MPTLAVLRHQPEAVNSEVEQLVMKYNGCRLGMRITDETQVGGSLRDSYWPSGLCEVASVSDCKGSSMLQLESPTLKTTFSRRVKRLAALLYLPQCVWILVTTQISEEGTLLSANIG